MKRILALAIAGIVLGGCQIGPKFEDPKPGQYPSYRALAYDRAKVYSFRGLPPYLNQAIQHCMVNVTMDHMTAAEIDHWDAYARGEIKVSAAEISAANRQMEERLGGGDKAMSELREKCPETIAEMDKYPK